MPELEENSPKPKLMGLDLATGDLLLWKYRISMPKSKFLRIALGLLLVFGGIFSFLPILGVWMLPLGLLVLSQDMAVVRRWRRKFSLWWERRKPRTNAR